MSASNTTPNYNLPQWTGSDHPTWQGDLNNAFLAIDTQMKTNAEAIEAAGSTSPTPPITYKTITCDDWDNGKLAVQTTASQNELNIDEWPIY